MRNVFVLGTGRCGTVTFAHACRHVSNFTTAHESRLNQVGERRLDFPAHHIEADNRLSWFLGRLDERYGTEALYVHMLRDEEAVARSYVKRWKSENGIVYGYRTTILRNPAPEVPPIEVVRDMCRTVNANIRCFLRDKPLAATVRLEAAAEDFARVWDMAGFEGDRAAALAEWNVPHNASPGAGPQGLARLALIPKKLQRILLKLPDFLDRA